ncbi:MAG: response regulator [Acidobacteria bacterium]|nr:response regulator [Acidobacteriota bacterium]
MVWLFLLAGFLLPAGWNFVPTVLAQIQPAFWHLTSEDGLSQNSINDILQDRRGFVWIATQDGLNRYDGYDFQKYYHQPHDTNSLSNSDVTCLYEDRDGILWIGTVAGLTCYNPVREQFHRPVIVSAEHEDLSTFRITCISADAGGRIWVGTENGLWQVGDAPQPPVCYRLDPQAVGSLSANYINDLQLDDQGRMWVATRNGLAFWDEQVQRFVVFRHEPGVPGSLPDNMVNCLLVNEAGTLWVGTNDTQFCSYSAEEGHFESFSVPESSAYIECIIQDGLGRIWFGTHGEGVRIWQPGADSVVICRQDPLNPASLAYDVATVLYRDRTDNIWVGTYGAGLAIWSPYGRKFDCFRHNPLLPESLGVASVRSLFEDREGRVWISGYNGFDRYDPASQQFTHLDDRYPQIRITRVIVEDPREPERGLWLGLEANDYDLIKYDYRQDQIIQRIRLYDLFNIHVQTVYSLHIDSQGTLWAGTEQGLFVWSPGNGTYRHYRSDPRDPEGLSGNQINAILADPVRNCLWLGTETGGLNRLDLATGRCRRFTGQPEQTDQVINERIVCITSDGEGRLWLGTFGGLCRLDPDSGMFRNYTRRDGLANDTVYGILFDPLGRLWLSTNDGISRLNPQLERMRSFNVRDGLQSNEFNRNAYHQGRSGVFYFGGINGFNRFRPEDVTDNPHPPPLTLTELQIFNQPVAVGESVDGRVILEKSITDITRLDLDHTHQVFTLGFAALSYVFPEKNRYAYYLEGLESDWNYVGGRRFATYTNLPAGDYVFRLKGANNDGVWNETGLALRVVIHPPFWETWWFQLLLLTGIVGAIVGGHLARTRGIEKRNLLLWQINEALNKEIAERKRAEEALAGSEEKYRTITDNIHAGIYRLEMEGEGRFIEVNPAMLSIFGYDNKQEFMNTPVMSLYVDPAGRPPFLEKVRRDGFARNMELRLRKKDGTIIHCSVTAVAVRDKAGELRYLDGLVEDITQRRRLEAQIRQTQKMEVLGKLAGGIAHDFNNILTVINGRAQLMLMDLSPEDPHYRNVQEIMQTGERAEELIRQLLGFSRKQIIKPVELDVNMVIGRLESMLRRLIGEDIELRIHLTKELPLIKADAGQLEQIFLNLVINARDAIHERASSSVATKRILMETDALVLDETYVREHPGTSEGDYVLCSVSDTGIGMNDDVREKIFEPFFTTKEHGTGLGLATVFGIVKQNRGHVFVYSEPDKGSTFKIYWPATSGVRTDMALKESVLAREYGGRECILIVEDDRRVRRFAVDSLAALGYRVLEAADGPAALRMLEETTGRVDLLVTDVIMPHTSGRDLANQVQSLRPDIRVLFMSGYTDQYIVDNGTLAEGIQFIQKPFTLNALARRVREILDENKG